MNSYSPQHHEPRWHAALALLAAIILFSFLPESLIIGPWWALPVLEALLVIPLVIVDPDRRSSETARFRTLSILLIVVITVANIGAIGKLVHDLLTTADLAGRPLIYSAIALWINNVIVFALWYWELDAGGPAVRPDVPARDRDFLFQQQMVPEIFTEPWSPAFYDYLFTSFTNSTAFSPTDTMPLTARVKGLMALQSGSALITVVLIAARAINILQ